MAEAIGAVTGNGIGIASMAQVVTLMLCRCLDTSLSHQLQKGLRPLICTCMHPATCRKRALTHAVACWDWCLRSRHQLAKIGTFLPLGLVLLCGARQLACLGIFHLHSSLCLDHLSNLQLPDRHMSMGVNTCLDSVVQINVKSCAIAEQLPPG